MINGGFYMKKITSLLLAVLVVFSLCVPVMAVEKSGFQKVNTYTEGQFTDVPSDAWCVANVRTAYEYGIMGGKTTTYFDVNGSLTVAQTIVMAARLHSGYNGKNIEFAAGDPWYQSYLDYAKKNGIVWKYDQYDVPITRAEFARILSSTLPDSALKKISDIEEGAIPDVPSDASYFDAVYRLYRAGVLTGNDKKGTFTPDSNISRGAAAVIIGRMADPSLRKSITLEKSPFEPIPMDQLANLTSIKKKCTDDELRQAYDVALEVVTPLAKKSREEQLRVIMQELRQMFDSGMTYSTDAPHYNDPYGYFVLGVASCAGCARATGLCLNILGIPYEHVNENQWGHQWCRVNIDGTYWICDAYGLYVGPEPAPYMHPYL